MKVKNFLFRCLWLALFLLAFIAVVLAAFLFGRNSVYKAYSELSGINQAQVVLENVGKLIELPNETPQMATIEDAESIKTVQPFLANAQNGDILIVYSTAQIALLYRPSQNKLIAVGPVTNEQPSVPQSELEAEEGEEQLSLPPPEPERKEEIETQYATTTTN